MRKPYGEPIMLSVDREGDSHQKSVVLSPSPTKSITEGVEALNR